MFLIEVNGSDTGPVQLLLAKGSITKGKVSFATLFLVLLDFTKLTDLQSLRLNVT